MEKQQEIYKKMYEHLSIRNIVDKLNTAKPNKKAYDLRVIAFQVSSIRDTDYYQIAKDAIIDTTMSCDREEQQAWMDNYMNYALFTGNGTPNPYLRAIFLAAYDLK
jgi:hypothetical protein